MSLLQGTLHTRRLLVEVSIVHPFFFLFIIIIYIYISLTNFVLLNIGLATMKENKWKGIASGIEGEEDMQVLDNVTPLVV